MEGNLYCKIGFVPHKYYFVVHNQVLLYCQDKGKRVIGQVHLSVCKIKNRDCSIQITTGCETLTLLFPNNESKDQWLEYIRNDTTKTHIADEIAIMNSVQVQFMEALNSLSSVFKKNPNLNEYLEKIELYGNNLNTKLNLLSDLLLAESQQEFLSCESIDEDHIASLQPAPKFKQRVFTNRQDFNVWSILKNQIQLPLEQMNIPPNCKSLKSLLEIVGEQTKYFHLIDQASQIIDQDLRYALVLGFVVSCYSNIEIFIPFLHTINETYELIDQFKYISQQVSVNEIAFHAQSLNYTLSGQIQYSTQFEDLCLLVNLEKSLEIHFKKGSETINISFRDHYLQIRNLMTFNPEINIFGKIEIQGRTNQGEINFYNNEINGQIGSLKLNGDLEQLTAINRSDEEIVVFKKSQHPILNNHSTLLPPSDIRFRQDIISMKEGNSYKAKQIILQEFTQQWFRKEGKDYLYRGGYFAQKN